MDGLERDRTNVRREPGRAISCDRSISRKSARIVRLRAQVQQLDAIRLLVVSQQPVANLRDHTPAARAPWAQLHTTAFRCPRPRTFDLQVAAPAPRRPGNLVLSLRATPCKRPCGLA